MRESLSRGLLPRDSQERKEKRPSLAAWVGGSEDSGKEEEPPSNGTSTDAVVGGSGREEEGDRCSMVEVLRSVSRGSEERGLAGYGERRVRVDVEEGKEDEMECVTGCCRGR